MVSIQQEAGPIDTLAEIRKSFKSNQREAEEMQLAAKRRRSAFEYSDDELEIVARY